MYRCRPGGEAGQDERELRKKQFEQASSDCFLPFNPILKKGEATGRYGTGHHAFFTNEHGATFIVYHHHNSRKEIEPRVACIDAYKFQKVPGCEYDVIQIDGPSATMRELPINVKPD